ncbi:MAG: zinc ribbon domain-containing protein [Actinomycetota bacterium]
MAFCPNCGRDVSDDASFCPACGATIAASAGAGGSPPPQAPEAAAPPPPTTAPPPRPPAPPMGVQPPYAQQPMGAPPAHVPGVVPPPPVKQKTGSAWKIAIIVGLIVILVIGTGIALLAVFVFTTVKAPVDVTNRYIEAINDGDAEEAWDLLHPDSPFRETFTLSTFESQVVDGNVRLTTWDANEVEVKDSRATVGVDMENVDGEEFRVDFELRKDGGDWKIYDYTAAEI